MWCQVTRGHALLPLEKAHVAAHTDDSVSVIDLSVTYDDDQHQLPTATTAVLWRTLHAYSLHVPEVFGVGQHQNMAVNSFHFTSKLSATMSVSMLARPSKKQRSSGSSDLQQAAAPTGRQDLRITTGQRDEEADDLSLEEPGQCEAGAAGRSVGELQHGLM
jgi:hypothetical protein